MELTVPLLTWSAIVVIFAVMALINIVQALHAARGRHIVELGSERDEFFVPGDPAKPDPKDYEDYDN